MVSLLEEDRLSCFRVLVQRFIVGFRNSSSASKFHCDHGDTTTYWSRYITPWELLHQVVNNIREVSLSMTVVEHWCLLQYWNAQLNTYSTLKYSLISVIGLFCNGDVHRSKTVIDDCDSRCMSLLSDPHFVNCRYIGQSTWLYTLIWSWCRNLIIIQAHAAFYRITHSFINTSSQMLSPFMLKEIPHAHIPI